MMEEEEIEQGPEAGAQMSFLEHLDELRKRLVSSVIIIVIAFAICWFVSDKIYNFLSIPIRRALSEASRRELPITGLKGDEKVLAIGDIKEGDSGRYLFDQATKLGPTVVSAGASVEATVAKDSEGKLGLFTTETLLTNNTIIPEGVRLPLKFDESAVSEPN